MTNPPQKPIASFDAPNTMQPKDHDPAAESGRSCLWRFITVGAWIVLVFSLIVIGGRVWFLAQIDPARLADMDRFENEIVTLPPDWQTAAKTPPKEVVDFQREFYNEVQRLTTKFPDMFDRNSKSVTSILLLMRVRNNDKLTTTELAMLPAYRTEFKALVEKTSTVVSMPDYTYSLPLYGTPKFLEMQSFAKSSGVMALLAARDGDYFYAMDVAVLPIRMVRREPRSWIITHLVACAVINISSETVYTVAEECADLSALRYGLALMNSVNDIAHPQHVDIWEYADWATNLAAMKATGYPIDLSPQPLAGYVDQAWEIYAPKFNSWVVENLPSTDPRVRTANENLDSWKKQFDNAKTFREKFYTRGFAYRGLVEALLGYKTVTFFEASTNNWIDVPYRGRVSIANFDLARLRLAQRIAELEAASDGIANTSISTTASIAAEHGTSATVTFGPAAIAATMQTIPDDPFSTTTPAVSLRFSKSHNRFYSIGPDEDDDGMKFEYDASNGTVSNGDIFLTP